MLKYRFKKTDGSDYPNWEEQTLNKVADNPTARTVAEVSTYVTTENMVKNCGGVIFDTNTNRLINSVEYKENDILLSNVRPYFKKLWISDRKGVCSSDVKVFRSKGINPKFLFYELSTDRFFTHIMCGVKGTKMPRGDNKFTMQFGFSVPKDFEEQQKIADFLSAVDNQIEIQRQRVDVLELQKKGLLDKVFSQELRFRRENGKQYPDWENQTIESDFEIKMCKRILKKDTQPIGDIPFYKIGTLGGTPDSFISKELYQSMKNKYNSPSVNDTLISCSGTLGKCTLYDGEPAYFQDSNIVWLEAKQPSAVNKIFLYYVLSRFTWREVSTTTIGRIYSNDLNRKIWDKPCYEEQTKIADFFTAIDNQIDIEKQRLTTMETIKKGLLQQMFV